MKEKTRQKILALAGVNSVYLPKAVERTLPEVQHFSRSRRPVTMAQASLMGATNFRPAGERFRLGNGDFHNPGILADWPNHYFEKAREGIQPMTGDEIQAAKEEGRA